MILTSEPIGSRQGRAWALIFLTVFAIFLASIAGTNAAIDMLSQFRTVDVRVVRFYPLNRVPSVGESVVYWKFRRELTGEHRDPYDVVVVGDSSALMSFRPESFFEATGLTAYNLGLDGSFTADVQTDLLELFLKEHPKPKLIIIHHSIASIGSGDFIKNVGGFVQRDRVREWLKRVRAHAELTFPSRIKLELSDTIDSLHKFLANADTIDTSFMDKPRNQYPSDAGVAASVVSNGGFLRNPATEPVKGQAGNVQFPSWMAPMMERMFAVGETTGIPMLYVVCPMGEEKAPPPMRPSLRPMLDQIKAIASENVDFFEPEFRFYPNRIAYDNAHLIGDGPERNTREIAIYASELIVRRQKLK